MADKQQERIVGLQRQLNIARRALESIKRGVHAPHVIAEEALDAMWPLDRKQPLQGLVGHEPRRASRS